MALATVPAARAQIPDNFGKCDPALILRTVERLNTPTMFARNFKNVDRLAVYEYLSDWFQLTIVVDAKGLTKAEKTRFEDQKISFGAADVRSAHEAIRRTLEGTESVYVVVHENWIEIMPLATFLQRRPICIPLP